MKQRGEKTLPVRAAILPGAGGRAPKPVKPSAPSSGPIKNKRHLPRRAVLFLIALLQLALLPANPWRLFAGEAALKFCVCDTIAPITAEPGSGQNGALVYGNHVDARPAAGQFAGGWMELLGEDGEKLGFIRRQSLRQLPSYFRTKTKFFWTKLDNPALFLLPGDLSLSSQYGFNLLRGETVPCVGEYDDPNGARWLLFAFSTAGDTGLAGVGARYAWGREADFLRLETYEPDHAKASSADMPARLRGGSENGGGGLSFDEETLARIAKHGFWIDPTPGRPGARGMAERYADIVAYAPPFITTDLYFHTWRQIFSQALRDAEEGFFTKALGKYLTSALAQLDMTAKKITSARPGAPREAIETARDMLALPLALLAGPEYAPGKKLSPAAGVEYHKILRARGQGYSAVTGEPTNYELYAPRAHYESTEALSRYFRAIRFLGEATLRLDGKDRRERLLNASAAALLCAVTDSPAVRPLYDELTEPLRVMAGNTDDRSVNDYGPTVRRIIANDENSVTTEETAEALHAAFLVTSRTLRTADEPPHRPDTAEARRTARTRGFSLIGSPFFYDDLIISSLTFPFTGTEEEPRTLARPEDLMAALGSMAAYNLTGEYAEKYQNYGFYRRLAIDRAPAFLASPRADTVRSMWLRVLACSFADSGSPQFFYRDGGLWEWKNLLSATASWTELRRGGANPVKRAPRAGGETQPAKPAAGKFKPPRPRGYVEPEPSVFAQMLHETERLQSVLALMKKSSVKYAGAEHDRNLEIFSGFCATALSIAEKEAEGQPLSENDFADIESLSRSFASGLILPSETHSVSDVIADNRGDGAIQAANGEPSRIFVYVNDNSAGPRITIGYVYSYYEFERRANGGRTAGEIWERLAGDPKRRDELEALRPSWYEHLRF